MDRVVVGHRARMRFSGIVLCVLGVLGGTSFVLGVLAVHGGNRDIRALARVEHGDGATNPGVATGAQRDLAGATNSVRRKPYATSWRGRGVTSARDWRHAAVVLVLHLPAR